MPDIYVDPDSISGEILSAMKNSLERRAATSQQAAALESYLGDVDFPDEASATAYYNAMKQVFTGIQEFRWAPERAVDASTRRRLEGTLSSPKLKIMFDYDVSANGSVEIEFWLKQKFK